MTSHRTIHSRGAPNGPHWPKWPADFEPQIIQLINKILRTNNLTDRYIYIHIYIYHLFIYLLIYIFISLHLCIYLFDYLFMVIFNLSSWFLFNDQKRERKKHSLLGHY